jgi:hypothetical protein
MMAVPNACLEPSAVAGLQNLATRIINENNFTVEYPDELVLMFMPVSLR